MLFLILGAVLILVGSFLFGYYLMWENFRQRDMPFILRPIGAYGPHRVSAILGGSLCVGGIALLFCFKWYAGLMGVVVGYLAVQAVHIAWLSYVERINSPSRRKGLRESRAEIALPAEVRDNFARMLVTEAFAIAGRCHQYVRSEKAGDRAVLYALALRCYLALTFDYLDSFGLSAIKQAAIEEIPQVMRPLMKCRLFITKSFRIRQFIKKTQELQVVFPFPEDREACATMVRHYLESYGWTKYREASTFFTGELFDAELVDELLDHVARTHSLLEELVNQFGASTARGEEKQQMRNRIS